MKTASQEIFFSRCKITGRTGYEDPALLSASPHSLFLIPLSHPEPFLIMETILEDKKELSGEKRKKP